MRPYESYTASALEALRCDPMIGQVQKRKIEAELALRATPVEAAPKPPKRVRSMRFCVPLPLNRLNLPRGKGHWIHKHRADEGFRAVCDALLHAGYLPSPPAQPHQRVRLDMVLHVWSEMDDDNALARTKPATDWLVRRGYIADDRKGNIERRIPKQVVDRKCPHLEIRLSQPQEEEATDG